MLKDLAPDLPAPHIITAADISIWAALPAATYGAPSRVLDSFVLVNNPSLIASLDDGSIPIANSAPALISRLARQLSQLPGTTSTLFHYTEPTPTPSNPRATSVTRFHSDLPLYPSINGALKHNPTLDASLHSFYKRTQSHTYNALEGKDVAGSCILLTEPLLLPTATPDQILAALDRFGSLPLLPPTPAEYRERFTSHYQSWDHSWETRASHLAKDLTTREGRLYILKNPTARLPVLGLAKYRRSSTKKKADNLSVAARAFSEGLICWSWLSPPLEELSSLYQRAFSPIMAPVTEPFVAHDSDVYFPRIHTPHGTLLQEGRNNTLTSINPNLQHLTDILSILNTPLHTLQPSSAKRLRKNDSTRLRSPATSQYRTPAHFIMALHRHNSPALRNAVLSVLSRLHPYRSTLLSLKEEGSPTVRRLFLEITKLRSVLHLPPLPHIYPTPTHPTFHDLYSLLLPKDPT